jgi:ABC-type branched-subunit amino acid transport system substrate-binding protein
MSHLQGAYHATWPWHTPCVIDREPEEALRAATARRKRTERSLRDARKAEAFAALNLLEAGVKQSRVVEITGYTREHVRRITDQAKAERGES